MKLHEICLLMVSLNASAIFAERRRVAFKNCLSSKADNDLMTTKPARSRIECSVLCLNDPDCLSAAYCKTPGGYTCQLSGRYSDGNCSRFVANMDCTVTTLVNPCENGGTFYPGNSICQCVDGFVGAYCQRRYRDCLETPGGSGIPKYLVQPWGSTDTYEWFCSSNHTYVAQIIEAFSPDVSLMWQEVRNGLPPRQLCRFLFLELLHRLTNQGVYDMVLTLASDKDTVHVMYKNVRVDSEAEGYALHWDSFHNDPSDDYPGDQYLDGFGGVGDSSKNLNGARFGTIDRDVNDCARVYNASWWYNPVGCAAFRLDPLSWPTNRSGTAILEKMNSLLLWLVPRHWHVEDDLVLR